MIYGEKKFNGSKKRKKESENENCSKASQVSLLAHFQKLSPT